MLYSLIFWLVSHEDEEVVVDVVFLCAGARFSQDFTNSEGKSRENITKLLFILGIRVNCPLHTCQILTP